MHTSPELDVALTAADAGANRLLQTFGHDLSVRAKSGVDLVTDADLQSEQIIAGLIREAFPQDEILGEEGHQADLSAERLWIIDPLDGTTNYAHGIPHFAVSIAFHERGQPRCGVIFNPARGDRYTVVAGGGARYNGQQVQVSPAMSLGEVLVGVGFYYDRGAMMEATLASIHALFKQQIHGVRRFGTAALDLCQVGMGYYGAFFEYQLSPWDFAAGRLFVEEAGGRISTCRGEPLSLAKTSVLASNGHLHSAVLDIVGPRHP
ncbi:MAG: inositol monophosphatase family protein [Planctomycetaceae bacterium]